MRKHAVDDDDVEAVAFGGMLFDLFSLPVLLVVVDVVRLMAAVGWSPCERLRLNICDALPLSRLATFSLSPIQQVFIVIRETFAQHFFYLCTCLNLCHKVYEFSCDQVE